MSTIKDLAAGVEGSSGDVTVSVAVANQIKETGAKVKMAPLGPSKTIFKISCEDLCKAAAAEGKAVEKETSKEKGTN
jgi:hypothetical protein